MKFIGFVLWVFYCLVFISFSQIPSAPNRIDDNGLKQGNWVNYYDLYGSQISNKEYCSGYMVIYYENDLPIGQVNNYYNSGVLKESGEIVKDNFYELWNGEYHFYYDNSNLRESGNYLKGNRVGIWNFYTYDGTFSHSIDYSNFQDFFSQIEKNKSDFIDNKITSEQFWQNLSEFFNNTKSNNLFAEELASVIYSLDGKQALLLSHRILSLVSKIFGRSHVNYITMLEKYAEIQFHMRLSNEFIKTLDECIELNNQNHTPVNCLNLSLLKKYGDYFAVQYDYDQALTYYSQCLEISRIIYGDYSMQWAEVKLLIAQLSENVGYRDEAIANLNDASLSLEKAYGSDQFTQNPDYFLDYRIRLAGLYRDVELFDRAEGLYFVCYDEVPGLFGENSFQFAYILQQYAQFYLDIESYQRTLDLSQRSLDIYLKLNAQFTHDFLNSSLLNAKALLNMHNIEDALQLGLKCKQLAEQLFTKSSDSYLLVMNFIADINNVQGDYQNQNIVSKEIAELAISVYGENSFKHIESLMFLAKSYGDLEMYDESIRIGIKCLKEFDKYFKNDNAYSLSICSDLAYWYMVIGEFGNSREFIDKSKSIVTELKGDNSLQYLNLMYYDIEYFAAAGNPYKSKGLAELCLSKLREKELQDSFEYLKTLYALCEINMKLGFFKESIKNSNDYLELVSKIMGSESITYGNGLMQRADLKYSTGFLGQSIVLLEKASGIFMTLGDLNSYSISLNNIASIYYNIGDYKKAVEKNSLSIDITKKILGRKNSSYLRSILNRAIYLEKLNESDSVHSMYKEILELIDDIPITHDNADILAMALNNCAQHFLYNKRDFDSYSKLIQRSQFFFDDHNLEDHELYPFILGSLWLMPEEQQINSLYEVLQVIEDYKGKINKEYASILTRTAQKEYQMFNYRSSDTLYLKSTEIYYTNYLNNITNFTDRERLINKSKLQSSLEELISYSSERYNENQFLYINGYELWININGLLNSPIMNRNQQVKEINDVSLNKLFNDYCILNNRLMRLIESPKKNLELLDTINELESRVQLLERNLNLKMSGFSDYKKKYSFQSLVQSIENNEVFIDVVKLSDKYLAYISSSKWDTPKHMVIENNEGLMELSHDYANRIHGNSTLRKMIDTSGRYYDQFWRPIAKEFKGIDKAYISLGGVYNNINLATLHNKETGKYLFEELDIEIVNSARSFIESKNKESEEYTDLTATLIGYPDYDQLPKDEVIESEDYSASSRDLTAQLTDSLSRGGRVGSLPGTKTEVETIAETLRKQNWTPRVLMESEASEYAVKRLKSPRVVHMATHGYFLEDIEQEYDENRVLGMDRTKVVENPMLRSGLLFSGANSTLSGTEVQEGENGILTAYEASFLNLENTELVVMSACETAKGDQKTGEGVYGLRKAIADAGAENIIMSLWKVDDKVTQEFMTTFYNYWLEGKMSIREAFKSTRSFIKSKYPQPYYWGAFILVGR